MVERDRDALKAAITLAAQGESDIAPVDAMLSGSSERFGRFYVTAVEEEERDQEAAIVYALETTAQRELEKQGHAAAEDGTRSASWPAAWPTISTMCSAPS